MKNGSDVSIACPLCHVLPDTQEHSLECPVIRTRVEVKGKYRDIFLEEIPSNISKTLSEITEVREEFI